MRVTIFQSVIAALVDAAESIVSNLNLASNPFYREFPALAIPANKQDLVNMQGSGAVRDLREAA